MPRSHPEIEHYTHWRTSLPIIIEETVFRSAKEDSERKTPLPDTLRGAPSHNEALVSLASLISGHVDDLPSLNELVDNIMGHIDNPVELAKSSIVKEASNEYVTPKSCRKLAKMLVFLQYV
jgi:hypothetical protein